LIGSNGKYDPLAKKLKGNGYLHLRPYVIYQWLTILKKTHPLYKCDPELPNWMDFKREVAETEQDLLDSVQHINERQVTEQDVILGDDIAQVRTAAVEHSSTEEADNSNLCTSSSYLADYAQYNPIKDEVRQQLETLAEVLNIDIKDDIN
jgi:hypothetical protein